MKASAVIYVKRIAPMREFYTQCLGFETAISSEGYCILESDSLRLSLVAVPDAIAATIPIETPPRRRANVPIKLAFDVPVIDDVRTIAASLGGRVDPQTTEWEPSRDDPLRRYRSGGKRHSTAERGGSNRRRSSSSSDRHASGMIDQRHPLFRADGGDQSELLRLGLKLGW